jgi:hypothetical protein
MSNERIELSATNIENERKDLIWGKFEKFTKKVKFIARMPLLGKLADQHPAFAVETIEDLGLILEWFVHNKKLSSEEAAKYLDHEAAHANRFLKYNVFGGFLVMFKINNKKVFFDGIAAIGEATENLTASQRADAMLAPFYDGAEESLMELSDPDESLPGDYGLYLKAQQDYELKEGHEGESLIGANGVVGIRPNVL